ncbi:uncharacterized protein TNCV_3017251 [Trichonephila clavipes]|nr:uncharacterized protein TNCV_3017251 [Trichonephila clavipes]
MAILHIKDFEQRSVFEIIGFLEYLSDNIYPDNSIEQNQLNSPSQSTAANADFLSKQASIAISPCYSMSFEVLVCCLFQHDGAPAHFSADVRSASDTAYPGRWIGRGSPVNWPARLPDFSCLDFFL